MDVARTLLPALAETDALLVTHGETCPRWDATTDEYTAWTATRDQLADRRDRIVTEHRDLLCRKCDGRGRVQWQRCGKRCFQCGGDGWTAKGRRQHLASVTP